MEEYLETTVDKFTFRVPTDRSYSSEGIWVKVQADGRVRVGVADYLQQHSGDVAFVTVKPVGTALRMKDDLAELETVKVNLVLPSPVSAKIVEVNPALDKTPEVVNQDPHGRGWLAVLAPSNWQKEKGNLLEPSAYFSVMQGQVEREIKKT